MLDLLPTSGERGAEMSAYNMEYVGGRFIDRRDAVIEAAFNGAKTEKARIEVLAHAPREFENDRIEPYCGHCKITPPHGKTVCVCGWSHEERSASGWSLGGDCPKERGAAK